jgi:hypothetical protein
MGKIDINTVMQLAVIVLGILVPVLGVIANKLRVEKKDVAANKVAALAAVFSVGGEILKEAKLAGPGDVRKVVLEKLGTELSSHVAETKAEVIAKAETMLNGQTVVDKGVKISLDPAGVVSVDVSDATKGMQRNFRDWRDKMRDKL